MRYAVIVLAVSLAGCAMTQGPAAPPAGYLDSGWRTSYGAPVSAAELEALRQSCPVHPTVAAMQGEVPLPNPLRDNALYRPGGEGLASAPPVGLAAADRLPAPDTRWTAAAEAPTDECLFNHGLIKAP